MKPTSIKVQLERHNTIFELLAWETLQNLMLAPHATAPGT